MIDFLIQARDSRNKWGHADWRKTLAEAIALAEVRAAESAFGKARVVGWNSKGKYVAHRVTHKAIVA